MAIGLNDGLYIKAPYPADLKAFVGTGLLFALHTDIPLSYRHKGMKVTNIDTDITYKLRADKVTWDPILIELPSWVKSTQNQVFLSAFGGNLDASRIDNLNQPSDFDTPAFTAIGLAAGLQPTVTGIYPNLVLGIPKGDQGESIKGDPGEQGPQGTGVTIQGQDSVADIKIKTATPAGLLWIATDTGTDSYATAVAAGDGLVSDGTGWFNIGPIRGPVGPAGTTLHAELSDTADPDCHPIDAITGLATALATISIDAGDFIIFKGELNTNPANKYTLETNDYICGIWNEEFAISFAKYNGGGAGTITNYTLINYTIL